MILLPNNPNVRLAAEQAARICEDRRLVVVPTRNAAEGVAALLAFDADVDAAANVEPMTAAGRGLATVQVTEAVRDAKIGGVKVKKGQTIALDPDDGLVAADKRPRSRGPEGGRIASRRASELVTLYYGEDATLLEAEAIAKRIGAAARRRRRRGRPRRPAALPLPDLGRVGEWRAPARPDRPRSKPSGGARKAPPPPPPPTDPAELLDTMLKRVGPRAPRTSSSGPAGGSAS